MRDFDGATLAALADPATQVHNLVWVTGRNRSTGALESLGLSDLDDHQVVTVDGQERTYFGAGNLLSMDPITASIGLDVRILQIRFAPMAPEVQQALQVYDPRLAPVEVHRALVNPLTGLIAAPPHRVWKGWVEGLSITEGENATATLSVASAARALTRTLTLRRSDAAQQRLHPGDTFRRYVDTAGEFQVYWGERRHVAREASATAASPRQRSFPVADGQ